MSDAFIAFRHKTRSELTFSYGAAEVAAGFAVVDKTKEKVGWNRQIDPEHG